MSQDDKTDLLDAEENLKKLSKRNQVSIIIISINSLFLWDVCFLIATSQQFLEV